MQIKRYKICLKSVEKYNFLSLILKIAFIEDRILQSSNMFHSNSHFHASQNGASGTSPKEIADRGIPLYSF